MYGAKGTIRQRGGSAFAHLYGTARWQRTRKAQLDREPLCRFCERRGLVVLATVCNHVNGHPAGETEQQFWEGPFNSLCADCHNSDQTRMERGAKQIRGCDADGWPVGYLFISRGSQVGFHGATHGATFRRLAAYSSER